MKHARTVLLTGAGRGIGLAATTRLLRDGYNVMAVDLFESVLSGNRPTSPDALHALQERFGKALQIAEGDVRTLADVETACSKALSSFGEIGAAVACAGTVAGLNDEGYIEVDVERAIIEVNLFGVMHLARATLPHLRQSAARSGWGRFLAISSVAGVKPLPRLGAYVASKHAVTGFVRSLALELDGTDVTANLVAPGSTRTEILLQSAQVYGLESPESFAHQQLTKRLIDPSEIAGAIAYLLSDEAGSITGSTLTIDGGLTLT